MYKLFIIEPEPPQGRPLSTKHTSYFFLLSGLVPGTSKLGWKRVPRAPATRKLALEASRLQGLLFLPW